MREIGNDNGGEEKALHDLNGHGDVGDGNSTMGRGNNGTRKERVVVSGDEIAMRIQRKMEYVPKCKTGVGLGKLGRHEFTLQSAFL